MPDPKDTKRQSVYMKIDDHKKVKMIARLYGRSANWMYIQMIREGIARRLSQANGFKIEEVSK